MSTVAELRTKAKALKIPRYSRMRKAELVEAIAAHEGYDPVDDGEKSYRAAVGACRRKLESFRKKQIGDCTLYLGDCREILPLLPRVDAVVTDPPYGIALQTQNAGRDKRPYQKAGDVIREARTQKHNFDPIIGDDRPFDPTPLLAFENLVLWGANNYADKLPPSHCWFSWDKKCGKAANSDIGDCELAWTRGIRFKTVRAFRHMWAGFQRDSEVGGIRHHPTQKPVALMCWCIDFFPTAEIILDPFMGSGTTGVSCAKRGLRFIGIEIDPNYFSIACRRIEEAHKQGDFFVPAPKKPTKRQLQDMQPSLALPAFCPTAPKMAAIPANYKDDGGGTIKDPSQVDLEDYLTGHSERR